jgi:sulfur-carrier protein
MIKVQLPPHLGKLARQQRIVEVSIEGPATVSNVLDALERDLPMLRGTIRDPHSGARRAFLRFYVAGEDISHDPTDTPLPAAVASGEEVLQIIGAIAGG